MTPTLFNVIFKTVKSVEVETLWNFLKDWKVHKGKIKHYIQIVIKHSVIYGVSVAGQQPIHP